MHFNFPFTAAEILWTLTFAALLVLLVVLFGRDRIRRFPVFTASTVLIGLSMLAQKLLAGRMAPLQMNEVLLVLADMGVIVAFLLAIELARRAFGSAKWPAWVAGCLVLLGGAVATIVWWGQWPPAKMVLDSSTLGHLRLMQLVAQKGDLFNEALAVELFIVIVIAGRWFNAGWRSHTQQILAGISASAAALIIERIIWETVVHNLPHTREGYNHAIDLQDHLTNANGAIVLAVMIWWIVCLWFDEPGAASGIAAAEVPAQAVLESHGAESAELPEHGAASEQ